MTDIQVVANAKLLLQNDATASDTTVVPDVTYGLLRELTALAQKNSDEQLKSAQADALDEAANAVAPALATEVGGHTSTYSVRKWLQSRATRVRNGAA